MTDRSLVITPGVDRLYAVERIDVLLNRFNSVLSTATGLPLDAAWETRRLFLELTDEAERLLEELLSGGDFVLGLQSPRYMSLLGGTVADDQLYRVVGAEQRRWVRALKEVLDQLQASEDAMPVASSPATVSSSVLTGPPKVFISHASADKDRFVLAFATALRGQGVDAWLDKWEMPPGASLPAAIFDGGIDECGFFLIVLSEHSINSKWVREELDAGVVRTIDGRCKLIPIVLDAVEVPGPLQHRKWITVKDLDDYSAELDEVVRTVYDFSSRPGLGPRPAYAEPSVSVSGLQPTDSTVLGLAAEQAIESGSRFLDVPALRAAAERLGISDDGFNESLEAIGRANYADVKQQFGGAFRVSIEWIGLQAYVVASRPDFGSTQQAIVAALLNGAGPQPSIDMADILNVIGVPRLLVELVLEQLQKQGLITFRRYAGNTLRVHRISPLAKRYLINGDMN